MKIYVVSDEIGDPFLAFSNKKAAVKWVIKWAPYNYDDPTDDGFSHLNESKIIDVLKGSDTLRLADDKYQLDYSYKIAALSIIKQSGNVR